jgi:hypothetical protein
MATPQVSDWERIQIENPHPKPESTAEHDEVRAWEPAGGDLWLPRRMRGSWRGGVLG